MDTWKLNLKKERKGEQGVTISETRADELLVVPKLAVHTRPVLGLIFSHLRLCMTGLGGSLQYPAGLWIDLEIDSNLLSTG